MLELKELTKRYKTSNSFQIVLNKLNIKFRKNEFVSILGPSGSGKTTLLNIIGGLDGYDDGDLTINGISTKKFKASKWDSYRNNCIGFIFQNYNLIGHVSILHNVEISMTLSGVTRKEKRRRALKALEDVGLKEQAYKKPSQLSGGQMQRVAIARAIVNNPDIILADEPTGALDSKTSIQIMKLIKRVSKDKLVIMVTHNDILAKEYSDRIIELKDGEIISDTNPCNLNDEDKEPLKIRKTSMCFLEALRLSLNNIFTKKGRTILTSFASSIGIIGILIILSLTNGFDKKIDNFEHDTMSSFPINISEVVLKSSYNDVTREKESTTKDTLYPYKNENNNAHENKITDDYVKYIDNIDDSLLSRVSYNWLTNFNILYKDIYGVKALNGNELGFVSLPKLFNDKNYMIDNYDLLYGDYPLKYDELVLIVDSNNHIDFDLLKLLGISITDEIEFDKLVGKEFKLVNNNDFYITLGDNLFIVNKALDKVYDSLSNKTLKITGIIREKSGNNLSLMSDVLTTSIGSKKTSKIGYFPDLIKYIVNENKNSEIVLAQEKSKGIVFMGNIPFEDVSITKKQALTMLGKDNIPLSINIYPKNFNSKEKLIEYLDNYNKGKKENEKIIYTDYAKEFSSASNNIMNAVAIVLVAFCSISLIVSSVMIGIITYISVLEGTKEIGILRSIGARQKDIMRVFNAETFIIGITSGLIGILFTKLLIIPINMVLYDLTGLENVAKMNLCHALILVVISVLLTLISGFIPAKIASKKRPVIALKTE